MAIETAFIMIKPDGVERRLVGEIISRFERKGFTLLGMKTLVPSVKLLEEHYAEHKGKPFLPGLVKYMSSGLVVAMVWQGDNVVAISRKMIGATKDADPGTIRGDLSIMVGRNLIHGSDSNEAAKREIALWFKPEERLASRLAVDDAWIHE